MYREPGAPNPTTIERWLDQIDAFEVCSLDGLCIRRLADTYFIESGGQVRWEPAGESSRVSLIALLRVHQSATPEWRSFGPGDPFDRLATTLTIRDYSERHVEVSPLADGSFRYTQSTELLDAAGSWGFTRDVDKVVSRETAIDWIRSDAVAWNHIPWSSG